MRQVRYRAVIALDPAQSAPASALPRQHHRHHIPLPFPSPHSAAQTGPGALAALAALSGAITSEAGQEYLNHTRDLMVRAESREKPGRYRSFPAELSWDDEMPLHPGDRHVVTVTMTDEDDGERFFAPGQRFTLWNGAEVGHGTFSRQMFSYTEYGPF